MASASPTGSDKASVKSVESAASEVVVDVVVVYPEASFATRSNTTHLDAETIPDFRDRPSPPPFPVGGSDSYSLRRGLVAVLGGSGGPSSPSISINPH